MTSNSTVGWDASIGQKLTLFASFLMDLSFKIKKYPDAMQKTKMKKDEWCENGTAPKICIFWQ